MVEAEGKKKILVFLKYNSLYLYYLFLNLKDYFTFKEKTMIYFIFIFAFVLKFQKTIILFSTLTVTEKHNERGFTNKYFHFMWLLDIYFKK